ncbi:MAG: flagellar biosynthesis protein FlhG [Gammaproteobacteria bacterium]|jgi:flagellar biosynthesis protein FlhG
MRSAIERIAPAGQAAGINRRHARHRVRVVAVTGGKGGIGKSNVSLNLSVALADRGQNVLLLDADLGLANIDVLLGLRPKRTLAHVFDGTATLDEVIVEGPCGIRIIPGASGVYQMAQLTNLEHAGFIHAFGELGEDLDTLIVDTAAGISDTVLSFARASQELLVVVCDEPASLTDAYALIKIMNREHGRRRFRVLCNMCRSSEEGRGLFSKLSRVCEQYLDVVLEFAGAIPYDERLRKAVQMQRAVVDAFPAAPAAQAFKKLAQAADNWPVVGHASGRIEFFVEQLIQSGRVVEESQA